MSPEDFVKALKERDFLYFSGVPDSTFGSLFSVLENDQDLNYVPAPKEDVAIGIASGFSISKKILFAEIYAISIPEKKADNIKHEIIIISLGITFHFFY